MRRPFRIVLILVLACSAHAAEVQLIPQGEKLSVRNTKRIEKLLIKEFPDKTLRKRAGGQGKAAVTRIVYFPLKQRSKQYVLAVASGRWKNYASRFTIYRMYRDSIVRVYTSRSWQANYPGYTFDAVQAGKDNIILFKEGVEDEERYSLASVFTFSQGKNGAYIKDLTPSLPSLSVKVEFPFRPLYAKSVRLLAQEQAFLTASDDFTIGSRWSFDTVHRRFIIDNKPTVISSTSDSSR